MMKIFLGFFIVSFLLISNVFADSLDETLEKLAGDAAVSYVEPIVSAFGSNLNGGWYHKAPKGKIFNIDVEFGLVFMGSFFSEESKDFSTTGSFRFTEQQAIDLTNISGFSGAIQDSLVAAIMQQDFAVGIFGPTIVGSGEDSIKIDFSGADIDIIDPDTGQPTTETVGQAQIVLPVTGLLEEIPMLPLFVPQLSLGTVYGTKLVFRYMPTMDVPDLGEFKYFGFGIQHNPKVWLPVPLPVDVSASFFTQSMDLGDYVTAKATAFGINASKTFGPRMLSITPYAGLMLESSKMEFKYDYTLAEDPITGDPLETMIIKFEIEGENSARLTLGLNFRLSVFNLNADYNIAKYNSVTAGFGLAF